MYSRRRSRSRPARGQKRRIVSRFWKNRRGLRLRRRSTMFY